MGNTNRLRSAERGITSSSGRRKKPGARQLPSLLHDNPCCSRPIWPSTMWFSSIHWSLQACLFLFNRMLKKPLFSPARPAAAKTASLPRNAPVPISVLASFRPSTYKRDSRRSEALEGLFRSPRSRGTHSSHEFASSQPSHKHGGLHLFRGISGQMAHRHCPIMPRARIRGFSILYRTAR